jgi:hypothetical protein
MENNKAPFFKKENYILMIAGVIVIAIGFMLMSGGAAEDPTQFNPEEVYSWRRITLAPMVVLGGFILEILAIFYKPKKA